MHINMRKYLAISVVLIVLIISVVACNPWITEHTHEVSGDVGMEFLLPDINDTTNDTTQDTVPRY